MHKIKIKLLSRDNNSFEYTTSASSVDEVIAQAHHYIEENEWSNYGYGVTEIWVDGRQVDHRKYTEPQTDEPTESYDNMIKGFHINRASEPNMSDETFIMFQTITDMLNLGAVPGGFTFDSVKAVLEHLREVFAAVDQVDAMNRESIELGVNAIRTLRNENNALTQELEMIAAENHDLKLALKQISDISDCARS